MCNTYGYKTIGTHYFFYKFEHINFTDGVPKKKEKKKKPFSGIIQTFKLAQLSACHDNTTRKHFFYLNVMRYQLP